MEQNRTIDQFPEGWDVTISPQYGNLTLKTLRQLIHQDAQTLFARTVKGGIAGFYPDGELPVYFVTDQLLEELGYQYEEFISITGGRMLESIHPDDRESYKKSVEAFLSSSLEFEQIIRVLSKDNGYIWMRDIGAISKDHTGTVMILILRSNITTVLEHNHKLEQKAALYEEKSLEMEALTANIPGGVCEMALDEGYTLVYGNVGFYKLVGYSEQQMREEHENHLFDILFELDKAYVRENIQKACEQNEQAFQFEHRIVRRDQSVIWILVRGNFSNYLKRALFNCVVIDITDRKRVEDAARMSEKRFRIALAQTDNSIFEYDINNRVMIHGDKSAEYYGLEARTENVPDSLVENRIVHPDTVDVFLAMYDQIIKGKATASCMIKARILDGTYAWRRVTMTTVFDENGRPVQAVGFLEDIDEQVKREEFLRYQSERDSLTGLYNRGAAIQRINQMLSERSPQSVSILFIIDIDVFKNVNDCYGHIFGDYVLEESSRRLSHLFLKDEIIGRIGGDEFIIFIKELNAAWEAAEYGQQILECFRIPFESNGRAAAISCSIGSATAPKDGATFEELYQNADIALYKAKKNGKNRTVSYDIHMAMQGEWSPYSSTLID